MLEVLSTGKPNLNFVVVVKKNLSKIFHFNVSGVLVDFCLSCFLPFRSKGVILNISSFSAVRPTPLLTIYSATKVKICFLIFMC